MFTIGKLFSCRHGAYSVVVATESAEQARAVFQSFLSERGVNVRPESISRPRSTRSLGERPLLLPGHDLGFVHVVMPEMAGDEVYVFDTDEAANEFAEFRGYEPEECVREEPVLDLKFVRESKRDEGA